jgi:hypothetical protein
LLGGQLRRSRRTTFQATEPAKRDSQRIFSCPLRLLDDLLERIESDLVLVALDMSREFPVFI